MSQTKRKRNSAEKTLGGGEGGLKGKVRGETRNIRVRFDKNKGELKRSQRKFRENKTVLPSWP